MDQWLIIGICVAIAAIAGLLIWVAFSMAQARQSNTKKRQDARVAATEKSEKEVLDIFNEKFRQELRNRGLLHFEEIINENAMFLQQDLRITASQVNDYMKQEIRKTLSEEFSKYEQSINDAKRLAIDSINKTQTAIEQQRKLLTEQLQEQFEASKAQLVAHFEENMADIVNHYIMAAIGDEIDLSDQLEYIIGDLESNKKAILEDISHGA